MKAFWSTVLAAGLAASALAAPAGAGDLFKLEFYRDSSAFQIGTDVYRNYTDYRHQQDLYIERGSKTTGAAACRQDVRRAEGETVYMEVRCPTRQPWLN
jgi:hypothetical protein